MKTALLFILLLSTNLIFAQSYNLEYKLKKGDNQHYKSSINANITQEVMGQEFKVKSNADIYVKLLVDKIADNGNIVIHTSLDSGKAHTQTPMMDTTLSLNQYANKRMMVEVTKKGRITEREMIDTVDAGMEMSGVSQRESIQFFTLPEKKVKVGDTWKGEITDSINSMGGTVVSSSNLNYKLEKADTSVNGIKCLKISFMGDTKSDGKANVQGQELFIEGKGKSAGVFFFDEAKGMIVASETNIDNNMTLATTGGSNMIIPMTQSMTIKYSLIK